MLELPQVVRHSPSEPAPKGPTQRLLHLTYPETNWNPASVASDRKLRRHTGLVEVDREGPVESRPQVSVPPQPTASPVSQDSQQTQEADYTRGLLYKEARTASVPLSPLAHGKESIVSFLSSHCIF